ncbi:MAG: nucleoside deaminase [Zoogloeaceae bacterium]|jgi:tRNA(Arg) A34 adenosine deaminase TadA|nr:nucleoside deaminase [Zoogloeaceae bacterium]
MTDASETDRRLLARAIALAAENAACADDRLLGGPFGAVIATSEGRVIAEGRNRVLAAHDPSAHAEIEAIRAACRHLRHFHLEGCTLYASSEPCPMCLAAAYWARLSRIVYANPREAAAAIGFGDADFYRELALPAEERRLPSSHLFLPEASAPLIAWKKRGRTMY